MGPICSYIIPVYPPITPLKGPNYLGPWILRVRVADSGLRVSWVRIGGEARA